MVRKRIKILVIITLMISILLFNPIFVQAEDVKGDINGDGMWSYEDILILERYLNSNKKPKLNDEQKKRADVNKDGTINQKDLVELADMDYPERPKDGVAKPEESTDDNDESEEFLSTSDWLQACTDMAKDIQDSKMKYDVSCSYSTFASSKSHGKTSNCAQYVSWSLQKFGVLNKNQTFYSSGNQICDKNGAKAQLKKYATIIDVGKSVKSYYKQLKPGDICCYPNHVNVYVGEGKGQSLIWMDAGPKSTVNGKQGSVFNSIANKSRKGKYGKNGNGKITHVIRLKDVGENSSGSQASANGDGYTKIYKVGNKTYKEFKQSRGSYKGQRYSGGTIASSGCGLTSATIVASAYGIKYNPGQLLRAAKQKYHQSNFIASPDSTGKMLTTAGLKYKRTFSLTKSQLANHLKSGKPAVLSVNSSCGAMFTRATHYIAILDIKGNNVYVSNPNPARATGWISIDKVIKCNSPSNRVAFLITN